MRAIFGALDGAGECFPRIKSVGFPARGLEEGVLSVKVKMKGWLEMIGWDEAVILGIVRSLSIGRD